MKKRLLSLLLVLALVSSFFTALPLTATAVEGENTVQQESVTEESPSQGVQSTTIQGSFTTTPLLDDGGTTPPADSDEDTDQTAVTVTADDLTDGTYTITAGGTYQLAEGLSGTIIVNTTAQVTVTGNGAQWDKEFTITSTPHSNLYFDCTMQPGVNLTLKDMFINNTASITCWDTSECGIVGFAGTENKLNIEGVCVLEYIIGGGSNPSAIHVSQDSGVTIGGSGTLYFYKSAQGAGIGGSSGELNGDITFAMTGSAFMKGTKQGALIGAGSGSGSASGVPGKVSFESGTYNLISNSRGAVIGGSAGSDGASAGTTVYVGAKANININVDFSGAAVGGGGYAEGNDSSGGKLIVTGGSLRTYIDKNAANNVTTGWNGQAFTEGINDAAITAQRLNSDSDDAQAVYLFAFDTTQLETAASQFSVYLDGSEELFYQGGLPEYGFVQEGLDKNEQLTITSTPSNWYKNGETNLYFYLTAEDHVLNVNGTEYNVYWNELYERFDTVPHSEVTFNVTPADADITVSDGMVYTYVENTYKGVFFDAVAGVEDDPETEEDETVEAQPAVTKFSLPAGTYTATIRKDGYYASQFSFKVTEAGLVTSVDTSNNVKNYLDSTGTFTISMPEFVKSTNPGAWDGVTLDVSWYSENAKVMYISTPAQLSGMAAIVNGIYNAEITTIIDDVDGDGTVETYTPEAYAQLASRKIRPANSSEENTSGPNGGNLVTSETYWYGAKSTGTFLNGTAELLLPSDFNGQTVYITADLDMGGYVADGEWTGARYMTIGGQSLMHYINYADCYSDGYSHLGSSFNGTLDGQGHIIKNIYCNRYGAGSNFGDSQSVGLIGRLGNHDGDPTSIAAVNPTVRNIAVAGYIYSRRSVGGIVGKIGQTSASQLSDGSTGGIIENCINFCEVVNTDAKGCGGIAGAGWNKGVIRNCVNYGSIYAGRQNGGGISGSDEVPVENCLNVGYVGAITYNQGQALGTNNGGAIWTNCYWLSGSSIADSVDTYAYPAV